MENNKIFDKNLIEENSDIFLKKIDVIKSIFSGRDHKFLPYTHNGLYYSSSKTDTFITEMLLPLESWFAETGQDISSNWKPFYTSFFKFCILFCDTQCNEDDWIFESFLKLSKTIDRGDFNESTADIMMKNLSECAAENEWHKIQIDRVKEQYSFLLDHYSDCFNEWFERNIRFAVNHFLDVKGLSLISSNDDFDYAISILDAGIRKLNRIKYNRED